jgi:hypothetical protein
MREALALKRSLDLKTSFVGPREVAPLIECLNARSESTVYRMVSAKPDCDAITCVPHILHQPTSFRECFVRFRRLAINPSVVEEPDTDKGSPCVAECIDTFVEDGGQFRSKVALVVIAMTLACPPGRYRRAYYAGHNDRGDGDCGV